MTVLREYLRRLWGALRRNPADHDLERELRFHLEHAEEELRRKGHSPAEAGRLATGFLVDVRPGDPVVFAVVGCLLAGVALLACLVPSRRAAKADPLATLRAD